MPGVARREVVGDVGEREVVREQRPLHHREGTDRRREHDEHVAAGEPQERRPPEPDARGQGRDTEHRRRGADRERRVSELGPHLRPNGSGGQTALASFGGS